MCCARSLTTWRRRTSRRARAPNTARRVAPGLGPRKVLPAEEVRRVGAVHDVHDTVMIFCHQAELTRLTITDVAKPQQAGIVSVLLEGLVE